MKPRGPIVLLTDFGTQDWYVGAVKGVILSRCPSAALVDLTHDIPPQDIGAGAYVLAAAAPWFPKSTIFLAVVDPGVGTPRALLAAEADGRLYVGPDNGLLATCLDAAARRRVVRLSARRYWLPAISRTFHGRDIMAPVAAHLACGGALSVLGPPVMSWVRRPAVAVRRAGGRLIGAVCYIDRFGNLLTNLPGTALHPRRRVKLGRRAARVVSSYGQGRARELIAVTSASGVVELSIRNGSAHRLTGARCGDPVVIG